MCGFTGFYANSGGRSRAELHVIGKAMTDALVHRGPDSGDIWRAAPRACRARGRTVRSVAPNTPKDGNSHMLSLLNLVSTVIQLYIYALFIFIIMGWLVQFNVINAQNRFVYLVMDFLYRVTEPLLRPIRNILPNLGGLDISPIVLVLGLSFLRSLMWEYLG